jgi:hypothetical protein
LISQAHTEGEKTRLDADDYVVETLTHLEMELDRFLNQVRNGILTLHQQANKPEEQ